MLDDKIDGIRTRWDLQRGLLGAQSVALPHETVRGYWSLPDAERKAATTPEAQAVYAANAGRGSTSLLCEAAFCWCSPLSRHRGNTDLLRFFENGLRFHIDAIRDDGLMATSGLNGETWAHGWDVEGLIYGMILLGDRLDKALCGHALERLRLSAQRHAALEQADGRIGTYGNQRCVWTLGLELYGQIFEDSALLALSRKYWDDARPKVLDASGQVIEQYGPCMHYSYTAFIYAWLNLAIRGDDAHRDLVRSCLDWFRWRHTQSLYPIAGPSSRQYYETIPGSVGDLWPAAEQIATEDASIRAFVDRGVERWIAMAGGAERARVRQSFGHAGSVLMWAILMTPEERRCAIARADSCRAFARRRPSSDTARRQAAALQETACEMPAVGSPRVISLEEMRGAAPKSACRLCDRTLILKRPPLLYVLVRQRYQTHFNFTDWLPFAGVQTWALGDEPPIIHPTPLYPSTTQSFGVDTARQGASHNWGLYGAGVMGVDGYFRDAQDAHDVPFLIARYNWLWRVVCFGELSTVMLEFGGGGAGENKLLRSNVGPSLAEGRPREQHPMETSARCTSGHADERRPYNGKHTEAASPVASVCVCPRRTFWTLNRVEPAEPTIRDRVAVGQVQGEQTPAKAGTPTAESRSAPVGVPPSGGLQSTTDPLHNVVEFAGRRGCLHAWNAGQPAVVASAVEHVWARGVRQLVYECDGGPAAFALSDNSFRFSDGAPLMDRLFRFADATGEYEIALHEGFLRRDNVGNFSIDTWRLVYDGTTVRKIEGK
jgi:hypothetical protein